MLGHLVRVDVAWGRENGGHGEGGDAGGQEEGSELHCCGLGVGVVDVIEQTGLATWEGKELFGRLIAGILNGIETKD